MKLINKLAHHFGLRVRIYRVPSPVPTKETPLEEIAKLDDKYLSWLSENLEVVTLNNETLSSDSAKRTLAIDKGTKILKRVDKWLEAQENAEIAKMRAKVKDYLSSRERIEEDFEDYPKDYPVPTTPTKETPLDEIAKLDDKYLPWLADNLEIVSGNNESLSSDPAKRISAINKARKIIKRVDKWKETQEDASMPKMHAKTKGRLSSRERISKVTSGRVRHEL